jgi:hypothetical protein
MSRQKRTEDERVQEMHGWEARAESLKGVW